MSVSIQIENVVKRYGDNTVVKGLSLEVVPGEFFTLLGPSGCGKTTLLRMIIGFNSIEEGQIKLDGKVINNLSADKRNMGMVFQNYAIFPHMSIKDNVAFGLKNRKLPKEVIERKVNHILEVVKMEEYKERMPSQLSGGQQQRVALARAIVIEPAVLLMDEPLSNLDAKLRVEMRNVIKDIQREIGITTIYVTHDQEEALAISDRIAVMNSGVIAQIDTPKQVYRRPNNVFVSTFIGLSNILEGEVEHSNAGVNIVFSEGYKVELTNLVQGISGGQKVKVSVRPEEFFVRTEGEGITGKIVSSVFLGLNTHYFIELADGQRVEVIDNDYTEETLKEGTEVKLTVDQTRINVYDFVSEATLTK